METLSYDTGCLNGCNPKTLSQPKRSVKKRLTQKQFNKAVAYFRRMPEKTVEIAYEVLVNGRTRPEVAEEYGVTRQFVDTRVNRIYDRYMTDEAACPKGWVKKEFCFPKELEAEFLALEAKSIKYRKK